MLKYTKDHEWLRLDGDVATVGITPGNLWVTRLRADFPSAALSSDLVLEATAAQTALCGARKDEG